MAKAYFDPSRPDYINIEDVKLQRDWSRFGGAIDPNGNKSYYFHIAIDDEDIANFLADNDFPIKMWIPKNSENPVPEKHMKISLPYNDDPSKAWLTPVIHMYNVDGGEAVDITKENVGLLDDCIVDHANITVRKYVGKTRMGVEFKKAQLVFADFYISGKKVGGGNYVPPYMRAVKHAPEAGQNPNDDLPF